MTLKQTFVEADKWTFIKILITESEIYNSHFVKCSKRQIKKRCTLMFNAAIGSHDHYRATQTYTINLKTSMRQFNTEIQ